MGLTKLTTDPDSSTTPVMYYIPPATLHKRSSFVVTFSFLLKSLDHWGGVRRPATSVLSIYIPHIYVQTQPSNECWGTEHATGRIAKRIARVFALRATCKQLTKFQLGLRRKTLLQLNQKRRGLL